MGWFMASMYDRTMRKAEGFVLRDWRASLLEGVAGDVLEVGAGTGANLPHYGAGVTRLVVTEPDRHMRDKLAAKHDSIECLAASLDELPVEDGSFDVVVATLVLCSVADPQAALGEIRRVLKPGGRLVFIEHVLSDDPGRRKWQRRIAPLWKWLADGCVCTRETERHIGAAGFVIERLERASIRGVYPWVRPSIHGIAVRSP